MLISLLESNEVFKIGHTFYGDISVMENTYKIKIEAKNLVNIEKIYTMRTVGLSKMAKCFFE